MYMFQAIRMFQLPAELSFTSAAAAQRRRESIGVGLVVVVVGQLDIFLLYLIPFDPLDAKKVNGNQDLASISK